MRFPMTRRAGWWLCSLALLLIIQINIAAQAPAASSPLPRKQDSSKLEKDFLLNLLRDQRAIWTAPFRLEKDDAKWVIPLVVSTGALIATDRDTSAALVENGDNQTRLRISKRISYIGSLYATGGTAGLLYLTGRATHNDRLRETGLLGAEALINGVIVTETLKTISQRHRPPEDNGSGEFFTSGRSFPSGHATSAWSLATVIAQEYRHRRLVKFGAYGLATAVSLSRYTGRKHFLSDVLVGSVIGYSIGRYVYRQHHDRSLDGAAENEQVPESKLYPHVSPIYLSKAHTYGAVLTWSF